MVTRCRYDLPDDEVIHLTHVQVEILSRIVAGDTNREIAHRLHYSYPTIKNYLRVIFAELAVSTRTEAALIAVGYGMVDMPVIDPAQHPHTIEPGPIRRYWATRTRRSARRSPNVTTTGTASHSL